MKRPYRRVLVVHPYGIGDLLFVTPVLRALRLIPGMERVDLLVGSRTAEIIRENPHVDDVIVHDRDRWRSQAARENWKELAAMARELRSRHYDLLLDFSLRREYAAFAKWILGVPVRAGLDYKGRACFNNIRYAIPSGFEGRHAIDFFAAVAEKAGIPVEDRFVEMYLTDAARAKAKALLEGAEGSMPPKILVVAPGGGESWGADARLKRWPVEWMANLANRLVRAASLDRVVIVGSPGEKELAIALQKHLDPDALDLSGRTDLMTTAAVLQRASCFLGNDGGLVHMAHAMQIPVVAIYGPADPKVYGPYPSTPEALAIYNHDSGKSPCYRNFRYDSDCECIQQISPEYAWSRIQASGWLDRLCNSRKGVSF